jgi:hypothetical protein
MLTLGSTAWGQGWYGPGWYGPGWDWGWGPAYSPYYYYTPTTGDVKIETHDKGAQVFIDGAYAGTTGKLKRMHLDPGTYNIEIRSGGRTVLSQRVYVVLGKSVHLRPGI